MRNFEKRKRKLLRIFGRQCQINMQVTMRLKEKHEFLKATSREDCQRYISVFKKYLELHYDEEKQDAIMQLILCDYRVFLSIIDIMNSVRPSSNIFKSSHKIWSVIEAAYSAIVNAINIRKIKLKGIKYDIIGKVY